MKGFTLIELLLVTAVMMSLAALSTPFYSRFILQNDVTNAVDQLAGSLRKAQIYAMMGRQESRWGVNYSNDKINLFKGSAFQTRDISFDESFEVNENVTISGFDEVTFAPVTGTPSASPTVTISAASNTKTLIINSQGVVSK
jgi:prepilin-type N-terminal cleavage/methylation domain-containing protein